MSVVDAREAGRAGGGCIGWWRGQKGNDEVERFAASSAEEWLEDPSQFASTALQVAHWGAKGLAQYPYGIVGMDGLLPAVQELGRSCAEILEAAADWKVMNDVFFIVFVFVGTNVCVCVTLCQSTEAELTNCVVFTTSTRKSYSGSSRLVSAPLPVVYMLAKVCPLPGFLPG